MVIWLIGISGSGKSTLADLVIKKYPNFNLIDGDVLRQTISKDLGYSEEDRIKNHIRACNLINPKLDYIVSMITPTESIRHLIKELVQDVKFVFINRSLESCIKNDVKGLYKKFGNNLNVPFQKPTAFDLEINTDLLTIEESFQKLDDFIRGIDG